MPRRLLVLPFALVAAWLALPQAQVSSAPNKTDPTIVFQTDAYTSEPVLIADPEQRVHLLFMTNESKTPDPTTTGALLYARLERGAWSRPRNVLVSPSGGAVSQPAVALDTRGYLHVVFKAGLYSQIYYSRAHVSEADVASGWSPVQTISDQTSAPGSFGTAADIAVGQDGAVHIVYAGRDGNVHYRRSTNGGAVWGSASTVVDTSTRPAGADDPRVFVDGHGRVNVTWTEAQKPTGWPPVGIFSSRSENGGQSWSRPGRIAGPNYSLVKTVAGPNRLMFRTWHSTAGLAEDRYQWSNDDGDTWSQAEKIPGWRGAGLTGYAGVGFDGAGMLHLVVPGGSPPGMYYLQSDGNTWTDPSLASKGALGNQSLEFPTMAISGGNQLHVVYEEDFARIWYTSRFLNAPGTPAQPVPSPPTPVPTLDLAPAARPTPMPTRPPEPTPVASLPAAEVPSPASVATPGGPLVAGAVSSVVLLLGVLVARHLIAHRS